MKNLLTLLMTLCFCMAAFAKNNGIETKSNRSTQARPIFSFKKKSRKKKMQKRVKKTQNFKSNFNIRSMKKTQNVIGNTSTHEVKRAGTCKARYCPVKYREKGSKVWKSGKIHVSGKAAPKKRNALQRVGKNIKKGFENLGNIFRVKKKAPKKKKIVKSKVGKKAGKKKVSKKKKVVKNKIVKKTDNKKTSKKKKGAVPKASALPVGACGSVTQQDVCAKNQEELKRAPLIMCALKQLGGNEKSLYGTWTDLNSRGKSGNNGSLRIRISKDGQYSVFAGKPSKELVRAQASICVKSGKLVVDTSGSDIQISSLKKIKHKIQDNQLNLVRTAR